MKDRQANDFDRLLTRAIRAAWQVWNSVPWSKRLRFEKMLAILVMRELLRKAESVHAMSTLSAPGGIDVVVRSAFETFADLSNLLQRGATYAAYMQYQSWEQQRSVFQAVLNFPNSPFSKSIATTGQAENGIDIATMLTVVKTEQQKSRARLTADYMDGNREPSDAKARVASSDRHRFVLAGLLHEYECVYRHLSNSAHGRVGTMLNGLVEGDEVVWPPGAERHATASVDLMAGMVLDAGKRFGRRYRKRVASLAAIQRERQDLLVRHGLVTRTST
jgi:hypothetical protein